MAKKKSSDYWANRFDQVEQAANNKSARYANKLEKKYKAAMKELDAKINAWYARLAKNNEITVSEARKLLSKSELEEFKWDVQQYIEYGQQNAIDQMWVKELENASAKFHINRLEALKLECRQQIEVALANGQQAMFDTLGDVYKESFYRSCFEIQKGFGVGFDVSRLDNGQVAKLLNKPWSVDGVNFSSKIWGNKTKLINTLDQELSVMVMTGSTPKKAIKNIQKAMNTSLANAKRLVVTEQAYFTTLGQKDCFNELDVEEYEIVATLDSDTSEICQEMDGKHFPTKEMIPGVNAPPFHPYCRTTTCPYFNDEFSILDKRVAKGEDGKCYEIDASMTYPEWKKSFVDGGNKEDLIPVTPEDVKPIGKYHEMKDIKFTPASTIEEAEEYAKQFVNSGGFTIGKKNVNYSGVSVDIANDVNYQLTQLYGNYDIKKFDSIETFGKAQKKYWSSHGEAPLCTSNFGNLMINKEICKNTNTIGKYIADGKESFDFVMKNMDKLSGSKLELAKRYEKAGRSLVGDTFKDMITHETGHHISYMNGVNREISDIINSSDWVEYASNLSGYANHSSGEYIAESWNAYIKGETELLDSKLLEIFERLVK